MEGLLPFATTLGLILLLELGDKTQLATISLATRHPWAPVLAGAIAGLATVTAIGAALGGALAAYLASWLMAIRVGGGILFIAFGAWSYLRPEREGAPTEDGRGAFNSAFALNFVAELGDKTQLAVIVLAATYQAPVSVFLGGSLGLAIIASTSVAIGAALAKIIQAKWLQVASTILFIAVGVALIAEAFLGG